MIKFRLKLLSIAADDPEAADPNAYIAATSALPLGNCLGIFFVKRSWSSSFVTSGRPSGSEVK